MDELKGAKENNMPRIVYKAKTKTLYAAVTTMYKSLMTRLSNNETRISPIGIYTLACSRAVAVI